MRGAQDARGGSARPAAVPQLIRHAAPEHARPIILGGPAWLGLGLGLLGLVAM